MKILFIGHASFKVTLDDGSVILIDPWFSRNPLLRIEPPAISPEDTGKIDLLLASHNHIDHIDRASLRLALESNATVIGSKRVAARAKRWGIGASKALSAGEVCNWHNMEVEATPAEHPLASDAIGFLIKAEGIKLYYSGDTRRTRILEDYFHGNNPDIAFLQIGCAKYFGIPDGMTPSEALLLALRISARYTVPMHFQGRFKEANPLRFKEKIESRGIESIVFKTGEERTFTSSEFSRIEKVECENKPAQ